MAHVHAMVAHQLATHETTESPTNTHPLLHAQPPFNCFRLLPGCCLRFGHTFSESRLGLAATHQWSRRFDANVVPYMFYKPAGNTQQHCSRLCQQCEVGGMSMFMTATPARLHASCPTALHACILRMNPPDAVKHCCCMHARASLTLPLPRVSCPFLVVSLSCQITSCPSLGPSTDARP